ncbi:NAD kinase [Dissostichus eleginoides]|uniref:NAD kinase n=1 Tax=Dissostichus eleginoides TaxID=100907 RepID=A0AAD9BLL1_DISEL|nr:NAD kinase [Dissostichus eleginoides]
MVNHSLARVVLMFAGFFSFLVSITFNSLSGFGAKSGVFKHSTEDVTVKYTTPITPAQWALFVWDFIYIWAFAMYIYFLVGLCRRTAYDWLYTTPAVLPYGFHVSLIINNCLNITWLFLLDRELLLPVLITSILMTLSYYLILFFSCYGLKIYGAWLNKYHNTDLWLIRILVQNVVANFYVDEHVRYIVTIYPVVILWLTGTLDNSATAKSDIYIFEAVILAISCIMLVARITLVVWKHYKRPLYSGPSQSPVEIALKQRKLFR